MKFIKYIGKVHRADTSESSKRFYGAIGWIVSTIMVVIYTAITMKPGLLELYMGISAGLLGLGMVKDIFVAKYKAKKDSEIVEEIIDDP